jgi:hypothetical protein
MVAPIEAVANDLEKATAAAKPTVAMGPSTRNEAATQDVEEAVEEEEGEGEGEGSDGDGVFEVERILGKRRDAGGEWEFHIKCADLWICMHTDTHPHTKIHTHTHRHTHTHTYIHTNTHTHTHTHTQTHTYTYTHIHTYTHTHTHTHTHKITHT